MERTLDRFYGKYRGTVAVNIDPLGQGRLKAFVPAVLGETMSGFALPAAPYAGTGAGFFTVPPIGAGVWIEFEAGEPSRPIWSGCWWGSAEAPSDEKGVPATQTTKILRTEFGLIVSLDDLAQTVTLSDAAGVNLITIQVLQGTIQMKSAVRVVLEAPLIQHGQGAAHPAVFGDQLLAYLNQLVAMFNSHVHPGELAAGFIPVTPAPPVPFFPPATPSLISTKVLVE
jgi:hypothetical protein